MAKKSTGEPLPTLAPGVTLVDTHCHLDMPPYAEDLKEVLARARRTGIGRIVTVGIDPESSRQAVNLAGRIPAVFATVGVHPHNVADLTESRYDELKSLARQPKVVAWGEIGMDLVRLHAPAALQRQHFHRQVRLAKEVSLPLVIHDREAHAEIMAVLGQEAPFPAGGVMHCFSGDLVLARQVIELGFFLSIPGVVTYNRAEALTEVVRAMPLDRLVLETDGPYLPPVPERGKRNEPAFLLYTARKVAELKQLSLAEVARQTTANAELLFGLNR